MPENKVDYHVRAILDVQSRMLGSAGRAVAGNFGSVAANLTKASAAAAGFGAAWAGASAVKSAFAFNRELENTQYSIATTLQLFDHNSHRIEGGLERMNTPIEQFNENVRTGGGLLKEVYKIAAASPASFGQTKDMFQNILPGARALTGDMQVVLDLTKKSLAIGQVLGGEYALAGSQLSRILTGGAGAEMETWRQLLQKPISHAAADRGWIKGDIMGEKLTMAFNKLDADKRLTLVQDALDKLGVATEQLGLTWDGLFSTAESNLEMLRKAMGDRTFVGLKQRFRSAIGPGGLFDMEGATFKRLEQAAKFIGDEIGYAAVAWFDKAAAGLEYVATHWETIAEKIIVGFGIGLEVAEKLVKFQVARMAGGAFLQAAGGVAEGAGALWSVGQEIAKLGKAALIVVPALAGLVAVLSAGFIAAIGVGAFFADNWQAIVVGIQTGAITLEPLAITLDVIWSKFVAVGAALMGTTDPADATSSVLGMLTEGLWHFMGVVTSLLRAAGYVIDVFDGIVLAFQTVYVVVAGVITSLMKILNLVSEALSWVPGQEDTNPMVKSMQEKTDAMGDHLHEVMDGMNDRAEGMGKNWAHKAADAWEAGHRTTGEGPFADMLARLRAQPLMNALLSSLKVGDTTQSALAANKNRRPPRSVVNIHGGVKVVQNFRDQDPDRVVSALWRDIERQSIKRVQATTQIEGGI